MNTRNALVLGVAMLAASSCVVGTSSNRCQAATDCAPGQTCTNGVCAGTVSTAGFEAQCMFSTDCSYGLSPICLLASQSAMSGLCTAECQTDADCGTGNVCVADVIDNQDGTTSNGCLQACSVASACTADFACETLPGSNQDICPLGCASDTDCETGTCDLATGLCSASSGGYCSSCQQDSDCGATGNFCVLLPGSAGGNCGVACTDSSTCPSGATCQSVGNSSGTSGMNCLPVSGACTATDGGTPTDGGVATDGGVPTDAGIPTDAGPGLPGNVGAACGGNSDCSGSASAQCLASWPGGYCSSTCTTSGDCPSNATCVAQAVTEADGGEQNACLLDCTSINDCRNGYVCLTFPHLAGGVCSPACTVDAQCTSGTVCNTSTGLCATPDAGTPTDAG